MEIPSPLKSVYSYYFPATRKIISKLSQNYPHDIFLQSIQPWLDDFHFNIIEKYINYFKLWLNWIENFKHKYFTNWSSEGIFHILTQIKTFQPQVPLYVLDWEYEWYQWYWENIWLEFKQVSYDQIFSKLKPGIFFISNPSARNWQIIPNEKINEIWNAWHKIVLDLTYLWMTKKYNFDLTNPSIEKIICSMSKPFWLYYYRIGFVFSKNEIKTLVPNKRFKNIFSLIIAKSVLENFNISEIYKQYKNIQKQSIKLFAKRYWFSPNPSDVHLLAYATENQLPVGSKPLLKEFKRWKYYRFCLTPYFHLIENSLSNNK